VLCTKLRENYGFFNMTLITVTAGPLPLLTVNNPGRPALEVEGLG
jgi:hypothetical protein